MTYPTSRPSKRMVPSSISSSMLIERSKVDLPEPEGPMMTSFSPSSTSRLMPLTAVSPLKRLVMFSRARSGCLAVFIDPCPIFDLFEDEGEDGRQHQVDSRCKC